MVLRLSLLVATVALAACGGKSKSVGAPVAGSGAGLSTSTNCKSASDCPKANPGFGANMTPANVFVAFAEGDPVDWRVYALDLDTKNPDGMSSARKMVVLLDKIPEGAEITPGKGEKLSTEASVVWSPRKTMKGKMTAVVRDYERCKMDGDADCDSYKFLKEYDKRFENLAWEVKTAADVEDAVGSSGDADGTVTVSDPNCGGAAAATTDADIQKKVLGTFIGALGNPGSILQTGIQIIGGGLGGGGAGATGDPKPC